MTAPRVVRIDGPRSRSNAAATVEAVTVQLCDAGTGGTLIREEVQDAHLDALGRDVLFLGAASPDGLPPSRTSRGNAAIGDEALVGNVGVRNVTTGLSNAVPVVVDGTQQLGTISSSRRYKTDVADMDVSARLMQLRPVVFRSATPYDDGSTPLQYGLIAKEVAEVFPEVVSRNRAGDIETVQHHKIDAMLLAETQQQARRLHAQARALEARLSALEHRLTIVRR